MLLPILFTMAAGIDMNRKMLADLAVNDADAFKVLAEEAKKAL